MRNSRLKKPYIQYVGVKGTNSDTAAEGIFVKKYLRGNLEEIVGSTFARKYEMIETLI
jgi:hypothetical protein